MTLSILPTSRTSLRWYLHETGKATCKHCGQTIELTVFGVWRHITNGGFTWCDMQSDDDLKATPEVAA